MKLIRLLTVILFFFTTSFISAQEVYYDLMETETTTTKFSKGDQVFTYWSYDEYWYPATIEKIQDLKYLVKIEDGESKWVIKDFLRPFELSSGDQVFCKKQDGFVYKIAEIGLVEGNKIFVRYIEDGITEWNDISNIRLK